MKKLALAVFLVFGSLFFSGYAVQAQCGGKAEPYRIAFKRGAHSSIVKGRLRGDEQAEYVFGAGAGQNISISIAAVPANSITLEMQDPNGTSFELQYTGTKWIGTLPDTGDYFMAVKIAQGYASRARYTLTLSIK